MSDFIQYEISGSDDSTIVVELPKELDGFINNEKIGVETVYKAICAKYFARAKQLQQTQVKNGALGEGQDATFTLGDLLLSHKTVKIETMQTRVGTLIAHLMDKNTDESEEKALEIMKSVRANGWESTYNKYRSVVSI